MTLAKKWGKEEGTWLESGFLRGDKEQAKNQPSCDGAVQPVRLPAIPVAPQAMVGPVQVELCLLGCQARRVESGESGVSSPVPPEVAQHHGVGAG